MAYDDLNKILGSLSQQPGRFSEVETLVEQCLDSFDLREAKALAKQLDASLASLSLGLAPQMRGLAARLKILALPLYANHDDLLNPFKIGLGGALPYETPDIIQRIKSVLLDFWVGDRNQWRQDIVTALHQNQDLLTAANILSSHGERPGTIANWLADYDGHFGIDLVENIKTVDYLYRSASTKRLTPVDRELLAKLFRVYEYLKLSSVSALGVEEELDFEENGFIKDFNNGQPRIVLDLGHYSKGGNFSDEPREVATSVAARKAPVVETSF